MKKLKLSIDDLKIESFNTSEKQNSKGTVLGNDIGTIPCSIDPTYCETQCNTACGDPTCDATCPNTCEATCANTCDPTCDSPTCINNPKWTCNPCLE